MEAFYDCILALSSPRKAAPAWYIVAADEGHGFAKKSNSDYVLAVWIEFIRQHLLAPAAEPTVEGVETGVGAQ